MDLVGLFRQFQRLEDRLTVVIGRDFIAASGIRSTLLRASVRVRVLESSTFRVSLRSLVLPGVADGLGKALLAFRASGHYWRALAVSIAIFRL